MSGAASAIPFRPSGDIYLPLMGIRTVTPMVVEITPELARSWLERRDRDRDIKARHVASLVRQLKRGEWSSNGDTIRFSWDGVLFDGQHRLSAVVETGMSYEGVVVFGLPPGSRPTIDTGVPRSAVDAASIEGIPNHQAAMRITRRIMTWNTGARHIGGSGLTFSNAEMIDAYRSDERIAEAASFSVTWAVSKFVKKERTTVLGVCHWLFGTIDERARDEFLTSLVTGANLPLGSPILALRNKLTEQRPKGSYLQFEVYLALCVRAWNSWREGRAIAHLLMRTGKKDERIPEPK